MGVTNHLLTGMILQVQNKRFHLGSFARLRTRRCDECDCGHFRQQRHGRPGPVWVTCWPRGDALCGQSSQRKQRDVA